MQPHLLSLLTVFFPLLGFVINGIGFKKISKPIAGLIGVFAALASFISVIFLFVAFKNEGSEPLQLHFFDWISSGTLQIGFSFLIDQLTLIMLLVITGIGSLIHLYSFGYMSHDAGFGKFFAFLNLFLFSMLLLVLGSNFLVMFVGWEGVGLCSFLLIGFWNKTESYNMAARKAFVVNRIGDLGFLIGIFLIFAEFGTLEYTQVFDKALQFYSTNPNSSVLVLITFMLFVGAVGKSAQIPLYTWLPDAMAGPTPVSALIHAATMVTAGIYMVVRSNILFTLSPITLEVVGIIGLVTALLGASIGLFQNDIKKVLAYSTVSQLGYMFLGLGAMAYGASMFHVLTHAFFKALLFLGAGSVIHAMSDEQDIRFMGGLRKHLPLTFITFLLGTIAISGIPPFSGFFSKDEILAHVFVHNKILWAFALLGSFMTAFYMCRLFILVFLGTFRGTESQKSHLHESPSSMTIVLVVLALLSVFGGLFGLPEVFYPTHYLNDFLAPVLERSIIAKPTLAHLQISHSLELILMAVSVAVAIAGCLLAWIVYGTKKTIPAAETTPRTGLPGLIYHKYYIDELYDKLIVKPINLLSVMFYAIIEFLVIDLFVNLTGAFTLLFGSLIRKSQTGNTGFYVYVMVLGLLVILGLNVFIF